MFVSIVIIILVISFLLALKSLKTFNEKPKTSDVKKSLDKNRVIFKSQSSSK